MIDTPGHSAGHVASLDERDGTLYAGDTFVNVPDLHVASVLSALFPLPTLGTADPDQTVSSAHALLDIPARFLALGHGRVVADPHPPGERIGFAARLRGLDRPAHGRQGGATRPHDTNGDPRQPDIPPGR